jgi:hypothetical protein
MSQGLGGQSLAVVVTAQAGSELKTRIGTRVAVSTASARVVASTFASLSVLFAGLPLSHVSAQPRLEEPAQAEDVGSRTKPEELKWAVTLYAGVFSTEELYKVLTLSADYEESYVGVAALSWQFFRLGEHIRLEVEGQVAKHFGEQHHWELNALVIARWATFPWNAYLHTTFAVGEGISCATEVPELEREEGASQWLNYLLFEVTFALPKYPAVGDCRTHPPSIRLLRHAGAERFERRGGRDQVSVLKAPAPSGVLDGTAVRAR